MKRRIFIAINLPETVKKKLLDFQQKWEFLPVRWTKKGSLHLTLVFIGYVTDQEMAGVCRITRKVVQEFEPFFIEFEKILYGPPHEARGKLPRMIWFEGRRSEKLSQIKKKLEEVLMSSEQIGSFRQEHRPFSSHITLARIKMDQWRNLQEKPQIEQDLRIRVPVDTIDVMESDLKRDGAEYTILEACPLGEKI